MTAVSVSKWRSITDVLDGEGSALCACDVLRDISEKTARKRFDGYEHTIWEILHHMNTWQNTLLRIARGEEVDVSSYAEAESWVPQERLDKEIQWEREKGRYFEGLEAVETMLNAEDPGLFRPLPAVPGKTAYGVLQGILLHNSYHTGQIFQLRQAAGLWVDPNIYIDAANLG